jgi:hypothetical protein
VSKTNATKEATGKNTTLATDLAACADALSNVVGSVEACGRLLAECCDRHEGFIQRLQEATQVSGTLLRRLEKVGRGSLDPRIALGVAYASWLERLPIVDQRRIMDEGVDVVTDSSGTTTKMRAEEMDAQTVARVTREGMIASPERQSSELRTQEESANRARDRSERHNASREKAHKGVVARLSQCMCFYRETHSVTITKPIKLTLAQLSVIIEEIS